MADHGEWTRKGAVLSDITAKKEYGVTREFIEDGIRAGQLEYRIGVVWGNPYLRVLRRQLEKYIDEQLGPKVVAQRELHKVKQEIADLKKQLTELEARKTELESVAK